MEWVELTLGRMKLLKVNNRTVPLFLNEKMDFESVTDIMNECFSMMGDLRLTKGFDRYDILLRFECERAYAFAEKGVIFNDVQSNKNQECGNP